VIRAFVAIEIDQVVLRRIFSAIDKLKSRIPGIRWTPQANCHLTLKFLGNMDEGLVDPAGLALERELSPFRRFTINAKGLGVFPDAKRPRVLWVGIEGKPLAELAVMVDKGLELLGFEREKRNFTPHLTIGRWRQFARSDKDLLDALEKSKDQEFGDSTVREVILFQSILNSGSAVYRRLKAARLSDTSTDL
jgi:RNA 2',3'-cyclic 3'-phosphodiesterase